MVPNNYLSKFKFVDCGGMHAAGLQNKKHQELGDQSLLRNKLIIVAEQLKSSFDLLESPGDVSWCDIWKFLGFQDTLNLDDIKASMSETTEMLKAKYTELIAEQDSHVAFKF